MESEEGGALLCYAAARRGVWSGVMLALAVETKVRVRVRARVRVGVRV